MFANTYTLITNGDKHYEITNNLELHSTSKKFNKPFKDIKTFQLTGDLSTQDITEFLKKGYCIPSYIKPKFLSQLKDIKNIEVLTDLTRYCIVSENPHYHKPHNTTITETNILEHKDKLKAHYNRLKEQEFYRFHDDVSFTGKLSRLQNKPDNITALIDTSTEQLCVYYKDDDTAYIYYNQIDPDALQQYLSQNKVIVWGVQNYFQEPLNIIKYPEQHTKQHLQYIRLKKKNLLQPLPRTNTVSPRDAILSASKRRYKLDRTIVLTAQFFIYYCLDFDKVLTIYEDDLITVLHCDIDKHCIVFADDNSPQTFLTAQYICEQLGGKLISRPTVTEQQALDPQLHINCMFLHNHTMLDLSGGKKREVRRIYNKIESDPNITIKTITEPEQLDLLIPTILPMVREWAKHKLKREHEHNVPIYYDMFITQYYRNIRRDVRELLPVTFIGIYNNNELQAFVVSEQVCQTWVNNTEAFSVIKPNIKQTRPILAIEEFKHWYNRLNQDQELIVCSGVTVIPGLKQMKINHYPCTILKMRDQL